LAIHAFTLENFLELWDQEESTGAYYLLPFVAISLAARNPHLPVATRLALLEIAFEIFFDYIREYPDTSTSKISEKTKKGCTRKTLWTRIVCKRACNLCVGLYWAISEWAKETGFPLALDRISSHPVECHFGTTRSTLDGDTRWESFLNAEISAILIRRSIAHLGLRPYIRRFKTEAGCTLTGEETLIAEVGFGFILRTIKDLAGRLRRGIEPHTASTDELVGAFRTLRDYLGLAGWREKAGKSSLLSGGSITLRLFTLSKEEKDILPEQTELLLELADE
jgi:hypothetical protein